MDIDSCAHLSSPVHNWQVQWKIFGLLCLTGVAAYLQTPAGLGAAFGCALLACCSARLPVGFVFSGLKPALFFLLLMLPVLVVTAGGPAVWSWHGLHVYERGLDAAVRIGLRSMTIMLLLIVLFSTAPLHVTMQGLRGLGIPAKLVYLLLFTYRYIFIFMDELFRLRRAVRLRGMSRARMLLQAQTTAGLVVNLLVHGLERSERIGAAMRLRGFTGELHAGPHSAVRWTDPVKLLCVLAVCAGLVLLELL